MERKIIVVDLDGTLCNCGHREHLAAAKQWDEFHSLLELDTPNQDVLDILYAWDTLGGGYDLIALTGRNERYRLQTERWFDRHLIPIEEMLMRPDDNYWPDQVLKPALLADWLEKEGLVPSNVSVILEDRDKVVEAWRNLGYRCWQTQAGGY